MTTTIVPTPTASRPRSVRIALVSVFAGVAVHVVALVVRLVWQVVLGSQGVRGTGQRGPARGVTGHLNEPIVLIVWTLVICGLGVFFALRMRAGSDGARVTLTVFAALEAVLTVAGLAWFAAHGIGASPAGVVTLVAWALVVVADATFLVTAFRRSAEDFFARRPR